MPRLNGNSSHGSKPMTSLSRTFSWMPHCWPQKQQCVLTSRSGSVLVESRTLSTTERCGPNRSMIFSESTGMVATVSPFGRRVAVGQLIAPRGALCQTQQCATASRAYLLVVFGAVFHLVRKPQLLLDLGQVPDHHRRR